MKGGFVREITQTTSCGCRRKWGLASTKTTYKVNTDDLFGMC